MFTIISECIDFSYIPRLIYHCCERLVQLASPAKSHSAVSSEDSENIEVSIDYTWIYYDFISIR